VAQHAEQHVVPKFYLRNFSTDARRLNLVNIPSRRVIVGASLRQQCARTRFYDFAPNAEAALAQLEDKTAPIIRGIVSANRLPDLHRDSADFITLMAFVVVQHLRGLNSASANDEVADYYAKTMLQGREEVANIDLSKLKFHDQYPVAIPLSLAPTSRRDGTAPSPACKPVGDRLPDQRRPRDPSQSILRGH
jgi:hypothetical protein